ncbi:MAG: hypothetical protein ABI563_13425, partial [Specibacter sp.]
KRDALIMPSRKELKPYRNTFPSIWHKSVIKDHLGYEPGGNGRALESVPGVSGRNFGGDHRQTQGAISG